MSLARRRQGLQSVRRLLRRVRRRFDLTVSPGVPELKAQEATPTGKPTTARPDPDARFRPDSPAALQDALNYLRAEKVRERHQAVERRVGERLSGEEPLRVVFIVSERSKWNADRIVQLLLAHGHQVSVALVRMERAGETLADARSGYEAERNFFRELPAKFVDTYDWDLRVQQPIETLEADVAFIQQPWRMESFPRRLVGRALPVYLHYGIALMANPGMHYDIPGFHPYLWRHYATTSMHRDLHLGRNPDAFDRSRVVGYPKLDGYQEPQPDPHLVETWPDIEHPTARVVVALHHSVGPTSLQMATFLWSHKALLALADQYTNVSWAYKPHPRLRHALIQAGLMDAEVYDQYENSWRSRPNTTVYDGPRYLDLFRTSDLLITDCGSFLAEYLPTEKPILRLVSPTSVSFNPIGERLRASFYEVASSDELATCFRDLVFSKNDPLRPIRSRFAEEFRPDNGGSADRIVRDLEVALAGPGDLSN